MEASVMFQFDYHSWMPNGSVLLRGPPPAAKGQSSMKTILEVLPNVGETVKFAAMFWLLSEKYADVVSLVFMSRERDDCDSLKCHVSLMGCLCHNARFLWVPILKNDLTSLPRRR